MSDQGYALLWLGYSAPHIELPLPNVHSSQKWCDQSGLHPRHRAHWCLNRKFRSLIPPQEFHLLAKTDDDVLLSLWWVDLRLYLLSHLSFHLSSNPFSHLCQLLQDYRGHPMQPSGLFDQQSGTARQHQWQWGTSHRPPKACISFDRQRQRENSSHWNSYHRARTPFHRNDQRYQRHCKATQWYDGIQTYVQGGREGQHSRQRQIRSRLGRRQLGTSQSKHQA